LGNFGAVDEDRVKEDIDKKCGANGENVGMKLIRLIAE